MSEENLVGDASPIARFPCIKIYWNPETQQVALEFNSEEFKDWHFVRAILAAAGMKAEETHKIMMAQAAQQVIQQQMMSQAQNQALANRLKLGRG